MYTLFLVCTIVGGTVLLLQVGLSLMGLGLDHVAGHFGDFGHGDLGSHSGDFGHGDAGGDLGNHGGDAAGHDVGDTGGDGNNHHPGLSRLGRLLTFQTILAFTTFFGVGGLASLESGRGPFAAVPIAMSTGVISMIVLGSLFHALGRLQGDGTVHMERAIGGKGRVYLRIPGDNTGAGKVTLVVQERTVEVEVRHPWARTANRRGDRRHPDSRPAHHRGRRRGQLRRQAGPAVRVSDRRDSRQNIFKSTRLQRGRFSMNGPFLFAQSANDLIEGGSNGFWWMVGAFLFAVALFSILMTALKCYKRCPSNKILVKWGVKTGNRSAKCVHGGGELVFPIFQDYDYLSLEPIQIEIPLRGALSFENIRVNVPSVFTVAIGSDPEIMQNAAIRLLGLSREQISGQASDIIFGQLRQVIASMAIDEINRDREKFLENIQSSLEGELRKIGLVLINVNITDLTDDSGYIDAIGRKAASTAVNQAEIDVAEQQKRGAIGIALAQQERSIEVANAEKAREIGTKTAEREKAVRIADLQREEKTGVETAQFQQQAAVKLAERDMRIKLADADAEAIKGENEAKANVAASNADLAFKQAESFQLGETRKREATAAVNEAQYRAETKAALAMAEKVEAEKRAALEAVAKAEKAKVVVDAEAAAERRRIEAEGEAKAIFAKLEAEARGNYEILAKKAEGLRELVSACGTAQDAFQLLMLEHMDKLSETAAQAISNIKFDKIIVWENGGGGGNGRDGVGSTANFLQNMAKTLPPMLQIMQDIGGVQMPEYFGKMVEPDAEKPSPAKTNGAATTTAANAAADVPSPPRRSKRDDSA